MTVTEDRSGAEVGRDRRRKEDSRLITGRTMWTENISLPGMLHLAILRSPMAHARITHIDVGPARELPGVVEAIAGRDIADIQGSLPCAWPVTEEMILPDYPPLAVDEVRHAGEPVAVVAARDRVSAIDALEAIEVDYEPLPAVLDMEAALADGADLVHSGHGTNKCFSWILDSAEAGTGDDVGRAEADAEVVIKRRYLQQRLIPAFMEPRSVVVDPTGEQITMWSATQIPHILRLMLAMATGVAEHKIRVIAPDVGGGFGGKLQVTPEEFIAFAAARRFGRPVKYVESRSESMLSAHHGRDQIQDITLCAKRDGTVTGLSVKLLANMGAYLGIVTPGVPLLGAFMYNAIYKFPAYRFDCTGVFTNTTKTDAYRGAGRPEATFAIERTMDELAAELGMDPLEVRRRNWIGHDEFPFTTVAGLTYDSGNYEAATDKAMELFGYDALRREQDERRQSNDPVQLGIGVSTYTEMCGLAPSRVLGQLRYGAGGWETASVRMLPTGKVEVVTGTSPHGQGHETAWSQIVADELGVPFDDVEVLHGDTRTSHKGLDTYGSRSLAVGGIALVNACQKVVDKAKPIAAHLLECDPADLEFVNGQYQVKGSPGAAKTLGDCALAVFTSHDLPDGVEPNLDADATFDPGNFSYPHGTHLCATEVDTETGRVSIRSYVAVDDVGRVVNPMIVEGQVHGGIAQGIGQALFEEAVYDADGNLLTGTFVDYLLPGSPDLPDFVTARTETPATDHPLGAKGVGEAGTIASTPAVVNAVVDALRPLGVSDVRMPCTPERVWQAIRDARNGAHEGGERS
ncbi:xanthine dehydrogenase family protein molybdopterin-binding subunit [Phytoactinopolyspora alkaliphila]|uniref:Xanthine dehydrogenase family protein molybdopterin-binding subunit n=1 Tax=Phytoactinopolyspora alkaliphila TaxID=1783498 RepID=A0A6N9YME4_9ACTN|nr:xanthine dehydrogenase family protein molybdopterin-binding subunit [Phytoactinopolyspora alkaliphila]NED96163.1 xanthine dehydrogenase family protein molybdopterin-binding subunit [Phytoactinopolyspora alkaliphila]